MKVTLVAAVFVLAAGQAAGQSCPGDVNLDGETTVDEIVSAVNAALNGCPAPLGCPLRFDEPTGDEGCFFVGRHHPLCGPSDLEATFSSDGEELIVSFFDPDIDFFADVVDDGIANLFAWQEITDPPQDPQEIEGEVLLSDPPREALTVFPTEIPFSIDDCDFERYEGRFAEYLTFAALTESSVSAASRRTARIEGAKAKLRSSDSDPKLSSLRRAAALRRQQGPVPRAAPARRATSASTRLGTAGGVTVP
jgi:hypothetical protein